VRFERAPAQLLVAVAPDEGELAPAFARDGEANEQGQGQVLDIRAGPLQVTDMDHVRNPLRDPNHEVSSALEGRLSLRVAQRGRALPRQTDAKLAKRSFVLLDQFTGASALRDLADVIEQLDDGRMIGEAVVSNIGVDER
jgi:hypothetical protein